MVTLLTNENLDPVRLLIVTKVADLGFDLQSLSKAAGRNVTYLQQFVRKGIPKFLPADVRDLLSMKLNVSPELLGPAAPNLQPPKLRTYVTRKDGALNNELRDRPIKGRGGLLQKLALQEAVLNQGKQVAIFNCPGTISQADVVDWVERPGHLAGAAAIFALWVLQPVGRLRTGDLIFVHPVRPPSPGDAVVVTYGREIVSVGELLDSRHADATILTAAGEAIYHFPQHQIMRVALSVFR